MVVQVIQLLKNDGRSKGMIDRRDETKINDATEVNEYGGRKLNRDRKSDGNVERKIYRPREARVLQN